MRQSDVPSTGARSWAALSAASVFGTNMGDFVSHILGLGHLRGLPVLALAFALVLGVERRSRRGGEVWYWLAIVVLRTAATNLGDLATHDAGLDAVTVSAGLALLLGGVLLVRSRFVPNARPDLSGRPVPVTDAGYWAAMLTAGTLGTVAGDFIADGLGLDLGSALCAVALLAAVLGHGALRHPGLAAYWATIVVARIAGTDGGDFLASHRGLGLGLPLATACSGLLMLGVLLLWRRGRQGIVALAAQPGGR